MAARSSQPAPQRRGAAAPGAEPRRRREFWVSEQVESIAVAVAMALVLKFFVIEAYQIPSGSMQPTILGDAHGVKDRVIADKLSTMIRDPRRWEVMIFRFPSDERRLYVKRIVGLPGETLEIKGGDIWIDGAIARKPDHVNESVLKPIHFVHGGGFELRSVFDVTAPPGTNGAPVTIAGTRATFAPDATAELALKRDVLHVYTHGYDPGWRVDRTHPSNDQAVADLDVALEATLDAGAEGLRITLMADAGDTVFFVPAEGSGRRARVTFAPAAGGPERVFLDTPERGVPTGEAVEVVARSVDHRVVLTVDGEEWLRFDDDLLGPRPDAPRRARVALGVVGGGVVDDVVVRRDIFYLPKAAPRGAPARWEIPPDHYFGLGDNTQSSYDSREWTRKVYTTDEGVVRGFDFDFRGKAEAPPDANPVQVDSRHIAFADVHGDVHVIDETAAELATEPAPFIHERYLLGKVLAVFWPVFKPFRWKLVR